jgi:hypothetical protein
VPKSYQKYVFRPDASESLDRSDPVVLLRPVDKRLALNLLLVQLPSNNESRLSAEDELSSIVVKSHTSHLAKPRVQLVFGPKLKPVIEDVEELLRDDYKHKASIASGRVFIHENSLHQIVCVELLTGPNLRVFNFIYEVPEPDHGGTGDADFIVVVVQNHL